jgi:hypothetical protein
MSVAWGDTVGLGDWTGDDLTGDPTADLKLSAARGVVTQLLGYDPRRVVDDTETFYTHGQNIFLTGRPVTAISAVTVDGNTVNTADYHFTADGAVTRTFGYWSDPRAVGLTTVTYTHGYDPVPDDLVALLYEVAAAMLSDDSGVKQSETLGSWSVTYQSSQDEYGLSPAGRATVARYGAWTVVS